MKRSRIRGIYAITPETEHTSGLMEKVDAAIVAGVKLYQYRNKSASGKLRREQCDALLKAIKHCGGTFIVNDDCGLAFDVGADGVHLGIDDGSIEQARAMLGPESIIGVSCYNDFDRACALEKMGADYVAFGSFFPSLTKPSAVTAPVDLLSRAKMRLQVPIVAIGGIDENNAAALVKAGADAVAVLGSLFNCDDVEQRARRLWRAIAGHEAEFQS
jgi:thiamine-phosphate pyrophosphorylase